MNITKLREEGYKVRIRHQRQYTKPDGTVSMATKREIKEASLVPNISLYGGQTEIEITTPDNRTAHATAVCSMRDNFNRKIGLAVALGRALSQLKG